MPEKHFGNLSLSVYTTTDSPLIVEIYEGECDTMNSHSCGYYNPVSSPSPSPTPSASYVPLPALSIVLSAEESTYYRIRVRSSSDQIITGNMYIHWTPLPLLNEECSGMLYC